MKTTKQKIVTLDTQLGERPWFIHPKNGKLCVIAGEFDPEPWPEGGRGSPSFSSIRSAMQALADDIEFTVRHWVGLAKLKDDPAVVRVDGVHYMCGDNDTPYGSRGFGGHRFNILFHDGRRFVSTNLWCQGDIPEVFRGLMPDNARFVSEEEFEISSGTEKNSGQ